MISQPRSMAALVQKPTFISLPILASVVFVLLAIGAQGGYLGPSAGAPAATPTPTSMASLRALTNAGIMDTGSYNVYDTVDNVTVGWGMSTIRFGSDPTASYEIGGSYSYLKRGDRVLVSIYWNHNAKMLWLYDVNKQ